MKNSPIRYHHHQLNTLSGVKLVRASLLMLLVFSIVSSTHADDGDKIDVWIGTGKLGIYHLTLDTKNGKLSEPTIESPTQGPGFLAIHPNGKVLYSTDRVKGSVASFSVEKRKSQPADLEELETRLAKLPDFGTGHKELKKLKEEIEKRKGQASDGSRGLLKFLDQLETGDGGAACVAVDKTGGVLLSAQYGGGSTSSYTIMSDGSLGERVEKIEHGEGSKVDPRRQATAHPHWVGTSPDNRFLMVPDLGLDRVVVYELDAETAKLKPHSRIAVPPGAGPRHMKFHTSGKYAYVLNEIALSVSVFEYDVENAGFEEIQLIKTLSEDEKAGQRKNSAAEIRVHPTGKFLYTSNRGHDSISVFSIDQTNGKLTHVENEHIRGATPRNFNLDPSGKWLIAAGQNSNTLSLFSVNQKSGKLSYTGNTVNAPAPICVLFGI